MAGTYARLYTKSPGDTILSSERNSEHQNHIDNADPDGIGDASADTTEFRATKLPSTGSLPVNLREDLQTLRYQVLALMQLLKPAITTWDEVPAFLSAVLSSPILTTPQINDTSADHQYIVGVSELAADRTVTLPLLTGNDVFVFADFIQILKYKTFDTSVTFNGNCWPSFSVHKNGTDQTAVVTSTWTKVTFGTEEWDTNSDFASDRFTPTVAGKYTLKACVQWNNMPSDTDIQIAVYENGAIYKYIRMPIAGTATELGGPPIVIDVDANGTTDYYEIYAWHNAGVDRIIEGDSNATWFMGSRTG
jgi:hypothetical protein